MPFGQQNPVRKPRRIREMVEASEDGISGAVRVTVNAPYMETYKEECFIGWYKAGRPLGQRILESLPEDNYGRKPSLVLFHQWRNKYGWDQRGDLMDLEARKSIEQEAVTARADMLKRHSALGEELVDIGMEFIRENRAVTEAGAIKLIALGLELERKSKGYSEFMSRLAELPDDKLVSMAKRLMGGVKNEDLTSRDEDAPIEGEFINAE